MKKHILQENYERFFGKREFGDPLPTFKGVMETHQENKFKEDLDSVDKEDDDVDNDGDSDASDDYLKNRRDVISKAIEKESVTEGWWDNISDKARAAYIKTHGAAPGSAGGDNGDDDDYDMGPDMDSRDYDMDDDDDKYDKYGQEMGGTPSKPSGEPEDDEPDYSPEHPDNMDDDELEQWLRQQDAEEDDEEEPSKRKPFRLGDDPEELTLDAAQDELEKVKAQLAQAEEKDLEVGYKKVLQKKIDALQGRIGRTGNELNQETLMIDGKQYRRISEGVEKQPKSIYAFSEFYQRFKK